LISAADFLGTAFRSGLITPITDRVLESACAQATKWSSHRSGLAIAVNLNDSQLLRRDLVSTVQSAIAPAGWIRGDCSSRSPSGSWSTGRQR
jgi:EAL domain-containing protein (putative c-di-GMP-specific phosphodiesterase class I)